MYYLLYRKKIPATMTYNLLYLLLLLTLVLGLGNAQKTTTTSGNVNTGTKAESGENVPSTTVLNNVTKDGLNKTKEIGLYNKFKDNKEMILRTFYVMLGVTSIVVVYFVVRAWRSKQRSSKSRRYGLLATSGADLEMEPLDRDVNDDDEMTMFERRK